MSGQTLDSVLNSSSGKQTTYDSKNIAVSGSSWDENLEDTLARATRAMSNLDCPDIVYSWLKDTKPFSYVVSFVGTAMNMLGEYSAVVSGESIKEMIQSNGAAQSICAVISNVFAIMSETIEISTKAAFAIFDMIDDIRMRLETVLKNLNTAVMTCIMKVYDMIELFLCDLIKLSLIMDWNGLEAFMQACPCICRFIAWLTNCDRDDKGNDISMQASAVITCIRTKYPFLDGAQVGASFSAIMTTYLKKYLVILYDIVNMCIDVMFTSLIIPLRYLIKKYVKFLRNKWDMSFLLSGMVKTGLDCLFVYSVEKREDGSTYYGMSILDMISSMKGWVTCLEYPCAGLSDRIKNKVKKFNADLRLSSEFWTREFECDLYTICMRMDLTGVSNYSEYFKSMKNQWNSIWDTLKSKKMEAKHCADDVADSSFGGAGDPTSAVSDMREMFGGETANQEPVSDAVNFAESVNLESVPVNGYRPLTDFEDEQLLKMAETIHSETADGDEYFIGLWFQFLRFMSAYKMKAKSFKKLCSLAADMTVIKADFSGSSVTPFTQYSAGREPLQFSDVERRVNYFIESDYSADRVKRILGGDVTSRMPSESLVSYYGRIYSTLG